MHSSRTTRSTNTTLTAGSSGDALVLRVCSGMHERTVRTNALPRMRLLRRLFVGLQANLHGRNANAGVCRRRTRLSVKPAVMLQAQRVSLRKQLLAMPRAQLLVRPMWLDLTSHPYAESRRRPVLTRLALKSVSHQI